MRSTVQMVLAGAVALGLSVTVGAQTSGQAERLTAWAISMSNVATGSNAVVNIVIDRWSTEAERGRLIEAFLAKGSDALLSALQKNQKVGYIKFPDTLGYDLQFARQVPMEDGGRRIVIATDRPISSAEARNQSQSMDYPFTLIEIRLKKDNTGEGKMAVGTKLVHNKKDNIIELEYYASEPVRLTNVKSEKK